MSGSPHLLPGWDDTTVGPAQWPQTGVPGGQYKPGDQCGVLPRHFFEPDRKACFRLSFIASHNRPFSDIHCSAYKEAAHVRSARLARIVELSQKSSRNHCLI